MITKVLGPILLAGAAAAAVALAPTSGATGGSECQTPALTRACANPGKAELVPPPHTSPTGAGYWPFDGGPNPPVWVLE